MYLHLIKARQWNQEWMPVVRYANSADSDLRFDLGQSLATNIL